MKDEKAGRAEAGRGRKERQEEGGNRKTKTNGKRGRKEGIEKKGKGVRGK